MGRVPTVQVGIPFEHREGIDPDIRECGRVSKVEPLAHLKPQVAERAGGRETVRVGHDQDEVTRLGTGRCEDLRCLGQREELAKRAVERAIGLH